MTAETPECVPGLDPIAARRFQQRRLDNAWLYDEVGTRMAQRLAWLLNKPKHWRVDLPHQNSAAVMQAVQAQCPELHATPQPAWWKPRRWFARQTEYPTAHPDPAEPVDMVWANMSLHVMAQPHIAMAAWFKQLKVQGFVMCSGLGPDSLQELRPIYKERGWPEPVHHLTDMHDWGDMLVQTGFAQPVMDMERLTLAYEDPVKIVADLRAWGRNLSTQRFTHCKGKGHLQDLYAALNSGLPRNAQGCMTLTLEVIYGHAVKPEPQVKLEPQTQVSLQDMRELLKRKS